MKLRITFVGSHCFSAFSHHPTAARKSLESFFRGQVSATTNEVRSEDLSEARGRMIPRTKLTLL